MEATRSTAPSVGLSTEEAERRLERDGPNLLPSDRRRGPLRILWDVVREPMIALLGVAASLYLAFGEVREALVLLSSVVVIVAIAAVQEGRTARVLDSLRSLSAPRARVLRDGKKSSIAARDLVQGDVITVAEGDRIPADAQLEEGVALSVDESLLTGESAPVAKVASETDDEHASLRSGTLVVAGHGVAEVTRTGPRSAIGAISRSLETIERARTPLETQIARLVRRVAIAGIAACVVVIVARGVVTHDWLHAVLAGVTLAMAVLPEEMPLVHTVFLALGAARMARSQVLTRRVAAIEALGSIHVLCTDKTGTLTQNRMEVRELWARDESAPLRIDASTRALPEPMRDLVTLGAWACPDEPIDPMDSAFTRLHGTCDGGELERLARVAEHPLSPALLAVTHVYRTASGEALFATKGAPEAVLRLCALERAEQDAWSARVDELGARGLRVIAVARGRGPRGTERELSSASFELLGLVGLQDPLRPEAAEAARACAEAGIRVVMITGDHPRTALAIAKELGLPSGGAITGHDVDALDDDALGAALEKASVVARALPAQKLRIVRALQERGHVVAMTGDGVNDAPALAAADIGVAMGARGTDVAREAADLVLLDDAFASIVHAIRAGRRIYDNLQTAFAYVIAVHVPVAAVALVPAFLRWPVLLVPLQVVLLELIIDPVCSIVLEREEERPGTMQRPPRSKDAALLTPRAVVWSLLYGLAATAGVLGLVGLARMRGLDDDALRTLAFVGLVGGNLAMLLTSRDRERPFWASFARRNDSMLVMTSAALAVTVLVVAAPGIAALFDFGAPGWRWAGASFFGAALAVLALDVVKSLVRAPAVAMSARVPSS